MPAGSYYAREVQPINPPHRIAAAEAPFSAVRDYFKTDYVFRGRVDSIKEIEIGWVDKDLNNHGPFNFSVYDVTPTEVFANEKGAPPQGYYSCSIRNFFALVFGE